MEIYKKIKEPVDLGGENKIRGFTLSDFKTIVQYRLPTVIKAVQYGLKDKQINKTQSPEIDTNIWSIDFGKGVKVV